MFPKYVATLKLYEYLYILCSYQDRHGRDSAASPVAVTSVRACPRNREIGRRSRVRRTTMKTKVVSETKQIILKNVFFKYIYVYMVNNQREQVKCEPRVREVIRVFRQKENRTNKCIQKPPPLQYNI